MLALSLESESRALRYLEIFIFRTLAPYVAFSRTPDQQVGFRKWTRLSQSLPLPLANHAETPAFSAPILCLSRRWTGHFSAFFSQQILIATH